MDKKIDLKEMQEIELTILKFIHDICEENGLNYYLCGGTLLGAIRHKGFIPWDDDIDIFMFRDDYMRLIDILEKTQDDTYEVLSFYNREDYFYSFAKVINKDTTLIETELPKIDGLGVYIDIFPIDGVKSIILCKILYNVSIVSYLLKFIYFLVELIHSSCRSIRTAPINRLAEA